MTLAITRFTLRMSAASLLASAALYASSASAACDPSLDVVEIDIRGMRFVPADTEICVGQTVRWTNNEPAGAPRPIRHTVTLDPELAQNAANVAFPEGVEVFDSGFLSPGQSFEQTFDVAGEYKYICRPHEVMGHVGRLVVVEP